MKLDLEDFPKINSSNDIIHFVTKGLHEKRRKFRILFYTDCSFYIDNMELHRKVTDGEDINETTQNDANLNVAKWTSGGKTLFHTAADAGNLTALDMLISKVSTTKTYCGLT